MIAEPKRSDFRRALTAAAWPIEDPAKMPDLYRLIGDARIVMLGEATHGTSEFYRWRRIISQTLIREHGFSFIAVEGDWPDCRRVHDYITAYNAAREDPQAAIEALAGYRRFPTWMWGNQETLELVQWLRAYNRKLPRNRRRIGFHGLDVYSFQDSIRLVVEYLRRVDPDAAEHARRAYGCFEPYGYDPHRYARETRFVPANCESHVQAALSHMKRLAKLYSRTSPNHTDPEEAYFDAAMNARVAANAEAYYRTMLSGDVPSWNVRDQHMTETLDLLLDHYGSKSRAIVWAHNTHVGDYRATDMLRSGYVNLGGIARVTRGSNAVRLIGFGTHRGTVMAARAWGEPGEVMQVPPAAPDSLEDHLHTLHMPQALLPLRELAPNMRQALNETVSHRAIGVVYQPEHERGNYVPTRLADRYDAFIFIDETTAVHALDIPVDLAEEPEAWPSGL